jgi:CHRD domain-containing protein
MRKRWSRALVPVVCVVALTGALSRAADDDATLALRARLSGLQEVPPIFTPGRGTFHGTLSADRTTLTFRLDWRDLRAPAQEAHIHFGQRRVAGGVMIFLCGGGNQPACPAEMTAQIAGTATAANVTGPEGQGIAPGDFAAAVEALLTGHTYVNVHTEPFPAGEVRGQVRVKDVED